MHRSQINMQYFDRNETPSTRDANLSLVIGIDTEKHNYCQSHKMITEIVFGMLEILRFLQSVPS